MNSCVILRTFHLAGFLDNILDIPNNFGRIFSNTIAILVTVCFTVGVILAIVGAIKWATGWDNKGGKKTIVKGIFLIGLSLLGGGVGVTVTTFL